MTGRGYGTVFAVVIACLLVISLAAGLNRTPPPKESRSGQDGPHIVVGDGNSNGPRNVGINLPQGGPIFNPNLNRLPNNGNGGLNGNSNNNNNNNNQQPPGNGKPVVPATEDNAKPKKKEHMKIAESTECFADVNKFCSETTNSNNFVVLDCLQNDEKTANKLSLECQHFLWKFKLKLTKESRFDDASNEACAAEFEKFPECKKVEQEEAIPCLIEHYEDIKTKPCSIFLNKMASIIFSDYRFMGFFIRDCRRDIIIFKCGRLELWDGSDDAPHSQGKTVSCLNQHRKELTKQCKRSLLKVAELQSDDFHLDRPLYYACKGDRENMCPDIPAGEGAVFKCLYKHLGDAKLSDNCRARLEERQQLIAEDVKADKSFYGACKLDIIANKCTKKRVRDEDDSDEDYSRSTILLCLEAVQSEKKDVQPECLQEMFELRSELMQDYKISPELVSSCENEIKVHCDGLKRGGNTLQSLMKKAAKSRSNDKESRFSSKCKAEISLKDFKFNMKFREACETAVARYCKNKKTKYDVISCLSEHVRNDTLQESPHRIDNRCRKQLKFELLQRKDVAMFWDYTLLRVCKKMIKVGHCCYFSDF